MYTKKLIQRNIYRITHQTICNPRNKQKVFFTNTNTNVKNIKKQKKWDSFFNKVSKIYINKILDSS